MTKKIFTIGHTISEIEASFDALNQYTWQLKDVLFFRGQQADDDRYYCQISVHTSIADHVEDCLRTHASPITSEEFQKLKNKATAFEYVFFGGSSQNRTLFLTALQAHHIDYRLESIPLIIGRQSKNSQVLLMIIDANDLTMVNNLLEQFSTKKERKSWLKGTRTKEIYIMNKIDSIKNYENQLRAREIPFTRENEDQIIQVITVAKVDYREAKDLLPIQDQNEIAIFKKKATRKKWLFYFIGLCIILFVKTTMSFLSGWWGIAIFFIILLLCGFAIAKTWAYIQGRKISSTVTPPIIFFFSCFTFLECIGGIIAQIFK
ncbi:hypothetical protein [Kurthia sibirica]|uniref:Uncharacterized protein n=1 Tax=Kurthia sibirica TaxID=202750 RepID=A0A2U3AP56_9BACL|nr:hypothetical protein [Kurthia sibirica]PWI26296.1 hypothetical protein DEX24_02880 [Kurthia sibirica]GEK35424.1 hypothetical protein KSI01_29570 [Kurthia sibirica]